MKGNCYVGVVLCLLLLLGSCSADRRVARDSVESGRVDSRDSVHVEVSARADSLVTLQQRESRDSAKVEEDARIDIEWSDAGKPVVIRIHREVSGSVAREKLEKTLSNHLIRDTTAVSSHTGGEESVVETVTHERTERAVGFRIRKRYVLLAMSLALLALMVKLRRMDR